jgi:hypothetical protein
VILPLAAQIHFLSNFHKEGYVYVHPSSFGYEADDPVFEGQCDKSGGIRLCKKGDAGRYSLATPRPGATADYWDNAYHFGDRDPPQWRIGLLLSYPAARSYFGIGCVFRGPERAGAIRSFQAPVPPIHMTSRSIRRTHVSAWRPSPLQLLVVRDTIPLLPLRYGRSRHGQANADRIDAGENPELAGEHQAVRP